VAKRHRKWQTAQKTLARLNIRGLQA
jgi:hypothetical protein